MPRYPLKFSRNEYKQSLPIPDVYLRAVNYNCLEKILHSNQISNGKDETEF